MTNRMKDAFDAVHADETLKQNTLEFLEKHRDAHRRFRWKPVLSTAALVVLIATGIGYYHISNTPIAYVSIDVNPSLELALNRFDNVILANAWNEDGETLLADVNVKGMYYTEAIDAIVDSAAIQPYLNDESELTFTVASSDSEKETQLLTGIGSCSSYRRMGAQSYTADPSSLQEAHDCGMSFGKYNAYLILSQYDDSLSTEECRNLSMAEIHRRIRNCEENGNSPAHDNSGHGHHHGKN